ncbi:MAG: toxin-antitoxin system HicB family antitoxin [Lachnospiraceae bacterium]
MKTINEYMKIPYRMEIVQDDIEGGYVISFPELRGCITCADTIEAAIASATDAKRVWLEAAIEDGYDIPLPITDESYSGQFKFRMPKSLHRQLAEHAKLEGISMNQYCIFLLSKYDALYSKKN